MKTTQLVLVLSLMASCTPLGFHAAGGPSQPRVQDSERINMARSIRRLDGIELSATDVERVIERLMAAGRVPGLGLAILNEDSIVYQKAFGYRDVEQRLPLSDTTILHVASFTKAMVAYLTMQLVEEGRIDLDQSVETYLSGPLTSYAEWSDLGADERSAEITPRMLLSHTAGLPNSRYIGPSGFDRNGTLRIYFDPGTQYSYSGEGFQLLQLLLEEVVGQPISELMNSRVFLPLGMSRTSMVWEPRFAGDVAYGYDESGESLGHTTRESARAAGSVDSNLHDIAVFAQAVAQGTGLEEAARKQMLEPQIRINSTYQFPTLSQETTSRDNPIRLSYGLGWGLFWSPYGKAYFKEGHVEGWEHYMVTFPEAGVGIVLMTNSSNGEGIFTELLAALIGDTFTPSEWAGYVPYDRASKPLRQP